MPAEISTRNQCFEKDIDAVNYNQHSHIQWNIAMDGLTHLSFVGNERVLDVGCGDGKISAWIANSLPSGSVIGLDKSEPMIRFASLHFPFIEYPNLLFCSGEATCLPFKEQFNIVVSFCCLHWIKEQLETLKNIERSLMHGGKTLLIIPGKNQMTESKMSKKLALSDKWWPYFVEKDIPDRYYYTEEEYLQMVEAASFIPISIRNINTDAVFKNTQELIDWITPVSSYAQALPENLRLEFVQDMANTILLNYPPDNSGKMTIQTKWLEIIAIKP